MKFEGWRGAGEEGPFSKGPSSPASERIPQTPEGGKDEGNEDDLPLVRRE